MATGTTETGRCGHLKSQNQIKTSMQTCMLAAGPVRGFSENQTGTQVQVATRKPVAAGGVQDVQSLHSSKMAAAEAAASHVCFLSHFLYS